MKQKENVDNIVFFNGVLDIRAGGPSGYIANLKESISQYHISSSIAFISMDNVIIKKHQYKIQKNIARIFSLFIPIRKYRKKLREKIFAFLIRKASFNYLEIDAIEYRGYIKQLDKYQFKTIICHHVKDAIFIKNYLKYRKIEAKLMLMSHSPEPMSEEAYHLAKLEQDQNADKIYAMLQKIEKDAFNQADVLVFPSKEAMEPYLKGLDYFEELTKSKKLMFIRTCCARLDIENSIRDIREEFGIKTKYIISFIGRHTAIKGYDVLKSIADKILAKRDDITFVIGGGQTSEISPLDHPRWIELGKINPADLLKITDLFILPNRQTYFDLILIETLSSGVPILASNTGGNKTVYQDTQAIELYDNQDDCINKIENFIDTSKEYKNQQRKLAKIAYENNYTLEHFAKNYNNLIINLTKEYEQ
ncbi:glycosyltransferase family 4 protein [Campylobacter sp. P091]|uniref:glycosyltransferase family 4 protein n=1 Tax=Campylobacter sp. P091 TaxID=1895621 RepID=UPI000A32CF00|nr:glycosyltransferase family 4 protein [Campylobacter sp. P091]